MCDVGELRNDIERGVGDKLRRYSRWGGTVASPLVFLARFA
jgi:hypothetical protein